MQHTPCISNEILRVFTMQKPSGSIICHIHGKHTPNKKRKAAIKTLKYVALCKYALSKETQRKEKRTINTSVIAFKTFQCPHSSTKQFSSKLIYIHTYIHTCVYIYTDKKKQLNASQNNAENTKSKTKSKCF